MGKMRLVGLLVDIPDWVGADELIAVVVVSLPFALGVLQHRKKETVRYVQAN